MKTLTPFQVSQVISTANTLRDKALFAVMSQCGLRRAEVEFLSRIDYDHTTGNLRVTRWKNRIIQDITLWSRTRKHLDAYLSSRKDNSIALFLGRKGSTGLGPKGIYHLFRALARQVGFPEELQHPHCLRHSIAAHLCQAGLHINEIQKLLGHIDPKDTVMYIQEAQGRICNPTVAEASIDYVAVF